MDVGVDLAGQQERVAVVADVGVRIGAPHRVEVADRDELPIREREAPSENASSASSPPTNGSRGVCITWARKIVTRSR